MLGIYNQNLNANYINQYAVNNTSNYGNLYAMPAATSIYQPQTATMGNYNNAYSQQNGSSNVCQMFMQLMGVLLQAIIQKKLATNQTPTTNTATTNNTNTNAGTTTGQTNQITSFKDLIIKLYEKLTGKTTANTAATTPAATTTTNTTTQPQTFEDKLKLLQKYFPAINIYNYGNIGSVGIWGGLTTVAKPAQTVIAKENIVAA